MASLISRTVTSAVLSALVLAGWPSPARATYSIVAFDRASGRFGGATASCVPLDVLRMVYTSVPGEGAVLTQSYLLPDADAHALALEALAEGQTAVEVLGALTDPTFDTDFELRQYAVIDSTGTVASFTGSMTEPYASDFASSHGSFEVVVAGNFLTGDGVLLEAVAAFEEGCDLEERIMNALLAASAEGRGDARCVAEGVPAQSALVQVERDDDGLDLEVGRTSPPPDNPVAALAAQYDAWRSAHPCPAPHEPTPSVAIDRGGCTVAAPSNEPSEWLAWLGASALTSSCRRRRRRRRHPSRRRRRCTSGRPCR